MENPKNLLWSEFEIDDEEDLGFEVDMRFGPKTYDEWCRESLSSPPPMKTASILEEEEQEEDGFKIDMRIGPKTYHEWYLESLSSPAPVKTGSILEDNSFSFSSSLAEALPREKVKTVAPVNTRAIPEGQTIAQWCEKYRPDPKKFAECHRQFVMTDGFDMDFVCLWYAPGPAIFKDMDRVDECSRREATHCAKFAISSYNEQHEESKLDFVELVNLNIKWADGTTYYITLKAKNRDGLVSVYQAKVWYFKNGETEVLIFREKPSTYPEIKVEEIHGCAKKVLGRSKKKSGRGKKKHGL